MPTPQRLPIVNSDDGVWGDILRQYLLKEHYDDGTDNAANGGHKTITIRPGTASAGTAPLKFTTGTLLTAPEAGAMEFAGDNYYLTDTSGPTRRKIAAYDDTSGATGDIYYRNSSGYFTRLAAGGTGDLLTVAAGIPSWSSSISNASTITLKDANFTLQDNSDTTKQLNFELSGISASTTRTLTVPDANTTIVGTDATQTLTNKTLTNPKISTIRDSNNAANISLVPASNRVYISPNGKSGAEFVNSTTPTEVVRIFSADSNGPEINAYSYSNTDSNLNLTTKGSGAVKANGVDVVTTTGTQTLTNKTLTSPKVNQILDTNGAIGLYINPVASAVNYVTVQNSTTGTYPLVRAGGSDTNISLTFRSKGTGSILFQSSIGEQLAEFVPITSAVNYTRIDSSATGNALAIRAVGTDTNISWDFVPKGTGVVKVNNVEVATLADTQTLTNKTLTDPKINVIKDTTNSLTSLAFASPASAVNYITVNSSATGLGVNLSATGSDGSINLDLNPKGSGQVRITGVPVVTTTNSVTLTNKTLTSPRINQIDDSNGATALLLNPVASAVNHFRVTNAVASSTPTFQAWGSDANVGMNINTKGTGAVYMRDSNGVRISSFNPVTSAVNSMSVYNASTGNPVAITAMGSDTNVGINLIPQGTGTVQANGVEVATISGTQTLTNKTISGSSNTITNIPASATPDASRLVGTTAVGGAGAEDGGATWAKIATFTMGSTYQATSVLLSIISGPSSSEQAIVSVNCRSQGVGQDNSIDVQLLSKAKTTAFITTSSFKVVTGTYGTSAELWMFKNAASGQFSIYELAKYITHGSGSVTYYTSSPWQSATPTGTVTATTTGVTSFGLPVATTTGTETLTNKTLTTPKMSYITDTNGNTSMLLTASASAVNFLQVVNSAAGSPVILQPNGSDTNIGFSFRPRGTGTFTFNTSGGANIAAFSQGTSPVNYFYFTPGGTGVNPQLATVGTDTNIGLNLVSKGTGTVQANGNPVLSSVTAVSAVTGTPSASTYLRGDGTWATPSGGSGGMLAPAQGMTLGLETFTISSGTVTQISGTTINGYTPAIGDRILVANAPATTGTGSSYSMTWQPTNGIYVVTGNTTNLTVSRATDMSGSVKPGGLSVYVQNATWPGSKTIFFVEYPSDASAFTWGTTSLSWKWTGGLSGQQQQIWINDNSLGFNVWNGTGWTYFGATTNSGNQDLTLPATATDTIVARTSTDTLTNKRITPRVGTTASSATPSINTDDYDVFTITALAADITSMTTNLTGTPVNEQKLMIRIKDDGSARTITWGASFVSSGAATLLATTVASKTHRVGLVYDSTAAKWVCIAVDEAGY